MIWNPILGAHPPAALPTISGKLRSCPASPYLGFKPPLPLFPFLTELSRRNFSCIGCGCPRPSATHAPSSKAPYLPAVNSTQVPSPRFVAALEPQMPVSPPQRAPHILTPSGRAFSVGGRVQNVSSDPLLPCIVFWPDNEPFPEQSQIRPNLVGFPVCVTFRCYCSS